MATGEKGVLYESPDAVWIDVSDLSKGSDGKRVYNIVANYAHNVGKVFVGDPAGLSDTALSRRLENMLSSSLKFGTTKHLWPHERQRSGSKQAGVPGIAWKEGDDAANLRAMAVASVESLEAQFPEIGNLRYNPVNDQIEDTRTAEPRSRDSLQQLARSSREGASEAAGRSAGSPPVTGGSTSIERAVFLRTLLRGTREEQSAVLARLGAQRSQRLKGALYSKSGSGGSADTDAAPAEKP